MTLPPGRAQPPKGPKATACPTADTSCGTAPPTAPSPVSAGNWALTPRGQGTQVPFRRQRATDGPCRGGSPVQEPFCPGLCEEPTRPSPGARRRGGSAALVSSREKETGTAPGERQAREHGNSTPKPSLWGVRHRGRWIREGMARTNLGPLRGQITRPALRPGTHSRGAQESSRRVFEPQQPGRPPSLPSRSKPRSPPPPRLVLGGLRDTAT